MRPMARPASGCPSLVRTLIIIISACLCVASLAVPTASATPTSSTGASAANRRLRIDALTRQLDALRKEAEIDAAKAMVLTYGRYSPERLANPKDRVTVYHLLDFVRETDVAPETREAAAQAVLSNLALTSDPDLEVGSAKGWARPRARFSKKVLAMLVDKDELARVFANQIMVGLWPGARESDIIGANPRNRKSATDAKAAWEKHLGRS